MNQGYDLNYDPTGGMGGGGIPPYQMQHHHHHHHQSLRKEGDWDCPSCGNLNFAFRTNCKRCGVPKFLDGGGVGPGGMMVPPPPPPPMQHHHHHHHVHHHHHHMAMDPMGGVRTPYGQQQQAPTSMSPCSTIII
eukprot:PhF_6_TR27008/c0_g1_i1/m.39432